MNQSPVKTDLASCQVLGQLFVHCDEKGVSTEKILEGIPYTREFISTPSNHIEWHYLVRLVDQVASQFSEAEIEALSAGSYEQPLLVVYKMIGRLRFDLRGFYLYLLGEDSVVTRFYPLRSEILRDDPLTRSLSVRLRTNPGLEPCENFFRVIAGQCVGISEVMGYGPSEVEVNFLPDGVEMSIQLPKEDGIIPFIRRYLLKPFTLFQVARLLQETQDELVTRNRELTQEKLQLIAAEKELRQQQEQLNLLAQYTPILLWSVNLQFETLYCSPSVEPLLGYTVEEAMAFTPLVMIAEESHEFIGRVFAAQMEEERKGNRAYSPRALRLKHLRKNGTTFWTENYLAFTRDEQGDPTGIVGVTVDIDEKVRRDVLQAQLEDQLNQAKRDELVGKVAGGIAHDFNNALQSIIGFSELTALGIEAGRLQEAADNQKHIVDVARSASELVQQLLAFSKQQSLAMRPIDLGHWLRQLQPMLESLMGGQVLIDMDIESGLVVMADPVELERVLVNLLLNSRNAMPAGGAVKVSLGAVAAESVPENLKDAGESFLKLAVTDTGKGVDEGLLKQIFAPYYTTKDSEHGTGLGLAVSAGIVEQHSGAIRAANNVDNAGLTIEVFLPLTDEVAEHEDDPSEAVARSLSGMKVLVADDQQMITNLVRSMLEGEQAEVLLADDGESAVSTFEQAETDIDLVLLDMIMPSMNGNVAAEKIRAMSPDTPIIFMTGYVGDAAVEGSLKEEMILSKPFSRAVLLQAVHEKLGS